MLRCVGGPASVAGPFAFGPTGSTAGPVIAGAPVATFGPGAHP